MGRFLRLHVQDPRGNHSCLSNNQPASEKPLPDNFDPHGLVANLCVRVVIANLAELVEKGRLWELDMIEPHTRVVKIIRYSFGAHIIDSNSRKQVKG
jgi:hypothetical protein